MRRLGSGIPFERAVELARGGEQHLEAELGRVHLIGARLGHTEGVAMGLMDDDEDEEWSFHTQASRLGPANRLQLALGQDVRRSRVFPVRKASAQTFFMDVVLIGRAATCDVVIDDPSISKLHARLRERDGQWLITDARSSNGTYVAGKRLGRTDHPLALGDVVRLGDWVFRFESIETMRAVFLAPQ